jgi:hypothetical protein
MGRIVPDFPVTKLVNFTLKINSSSMNIPLKDRPQLHRVERVVDSIAEETHVGVKDVQTSKELLQGMKSSQY